MSIVLNNEDLRKCVSLKALAYVDELHAKVDKLKNENRNSLSMKDSLNIVKNERMIELMNEFIVKNIQNVSNKNFKVDVKAPFTESYVETLPMNSEIFDFVVATGYVDTENSFTSMVLR